jgi:hypothetical protein
VLEKVVLAMEPALIAFASAEWARVVVSFRTMDLSLVALEARFVPEGFVGTWLLAADVWTDVLVLVSSVAA